MPIRTTVPLREGYLGSMLVWGSVGSLSSSGVKGLVRLKAMNRFHGWILEGSCRLGARREGIESCIEFRACRFRA